MCGWGYPRGFCRRGFALLDKFGVNLFGGALWDEAATPGTVVSFVEVAMVWGLLAVTSGSTDRGRGFALLDNFGFILSCGRRGCGFALLDNFRFIL